MRKLLFFILPWIIARTPVVSYRDYTDKEKAQWIELCETIHGLKGNGSGFIEKLHRGKSLTVLREHINSEKNNPHDEYYDDYSGEVEEVEGAFDYGENSYYMHMDLPGIQYTEE